MLRKIPFVNEEFHHVFNRGVDKREIFMCTDDYERFFICLYLLNCEEDGLMDKWRYFRKSNPRARLSEFREINQEEKLVDIICYCLNPNHYHLMLRQNKEQGVEIFMHKLGTSHSNFFNKKYDRTGSLFQGPFKSVYIKTNEQLLYLSAYINVNNFIHGYSESLALGKGLWPYSSLPDYLGKRRESFCNMEPVLGQFRDKKEYKKFVISNALYMKEKKEMEEYILE